MSLERTLGALMQLGLSYTEAIIYLQLATVGPQNAETVAKALRLTLPQVHSSLRLLRTKKIVMLEYSTQFAALPFESTLDLLVKAKRKDAQNTEDKREEILSHWRSVTHVNSATK